MKITVYSPQQLQNTRATLLREVYNLIKQQQRSNHRYAYKINTLLNKMEEIDRQIGD